MSTINETYSLDDQIIGASYIVFAGITVIFYIPCLIVIRTDSELKHHSCLRIMFHAGVSDVLHVVGLGVCGLFSLTGYAYTMPLWLNHFLMNITGGLGFYSYIMLSNVLALNRCVRFNLSELWNDKLFGEKATTGWIIFCWFFACCWFGYHLSPWAGFVYFPKLWCYYFDFNMPYIEQTQLAALINCIVQISCIWVWCILAVVGFKKEVSVIAGGSATLRKKERSLLIQSVTICVVLFLMDQYWHNIHSTICPSTFLYCGAIGHYLMILNNAVNPILYLTLNETIKMKVLILVGLKSNNQVQPTSTHRSQVKTSRIK